MNNLFDSIQAFRKEGLDMIVVTVTEKVGSGPVNIGKKMVVTEDGRAVGTIGGGKIEFYAREKCKEILKTRTHLTEKYILNESLDIQVDTGEVRLDMACGGRVTLYYEFVGPRQFVYIFGAGHCGQALVRVLKPLGFYTVVIDDREVVLNAFEGGDRKVFSGFVDYIEKNGIKENSFLVVCTPSHTNDYHVLNKILEKKIKVAYFGMLCSTRKLGEYLDKTFERFGHDLDLSNFYSPIGLDLGDNSPEDIAIAIAAEMLEIISGKTESKHLRETLDEKHRYWIKK